MARRPEFDREAVVRKAMDVFWADGYHGASMSRLGEAMGLQPGSIYAAFQSKEGLFKEALQQYVGHVRRLSKRTSDPRQCLEAWFAAHIDAAVEGQRGCLLLNATTEIPRMDNGTADAVKAELDVLESFFTECVTRARPEVSSPSARATARLLVAALAGISAMSRAGLGRRHLNEVAEAALSLV